MTGIRHTQRKEHTQTQCGGTHHKVSVRLGANLDLGVLTYRSVAINVSVKFPNLIVWWWL